MKKRFLALFSLVLVLLAAASCGKDDAYDEDEVNKQTSIV